jgi:prevent-host-death family protein
MKVPIREFKARLSHYLRAARAGKDVVVTSRGRALVRVVPVLAEQPTESTSREELIEKLKTLMPGVRIGTRKFELPRKTIKIRPGERTMQEIVAEGRR